MHVDIFVQTDFERYIRIQVNEDWNINWYNMHVSVSVRKNAVGPHWNNNLGLSPKFRIGKIDLWDLFHTCFCTHQTK